MPTLDEVIDEHLALAYLDGHHPNDIREALKTALRPWLVNENEGK